MKKRIFELVGITTNLILIGKYFFDKLTIRCEPCIDLNDCPPCQTDFMKNFCLYFVTLNVVFVIVLIMKNKLQKKK